MSEQLANNIDRQTDDDVLSLEELGRLCSTVNPDSLELERVMALTQNPNVYGESGLIFNKGDIPTEPGKAYRQIGHRGLEYLARSGIVMNGSTSRGEPHKRWAHRVFWHSGVAGKAINTGGRFVLVASLASLQKGWVTAPDLEAIYVQDGEKVVNILDKQE